MLKRIDLTRDYEKHKQEYMDAIEAVCRETAFSGGSFADKFDRSEEHTSELQSHLT